MSNFDSKNMKVSSNNGNESNNPPHQIQIPVNTLLNQNINMADQAHSNGNNNGDFQYIIEPEKLSDLCNKIDNYTTKINDYSAMISSKIGILSSKIDNLTTHFVSQQEQINQSLELMRQSNENQVKLMKSFEDYLKNNYDSLKTKKNGRFK